eukprot:c20820_g1_i1 orf=66-641(+)
MAAMRMGSILGHHQHAAHCQHRPLSCATITSTTKQAQVKVSVGPIGNLVERVFPVTRKLGPSSTIVVVTLPKPLGIVFELSKVANRRIFVAELIRNGNADRAARVNKLFEGQKSRETKDGKIIYGGGVNVGDLLLATTTVNVVVDLFGLRAPQRVVMFFDAEGRTWTETMGAIQSSFVADGPVTLVLERES